MPVYTYGEEEDGLVYKDAVKRRDSEHTHPKKHTIIFILPSQRCDLQLSLPCSLFSSTLLRWRDALPTPTSDRPHRMSFLQLVVSYTFLLFVGALKIKFN